MFIKKMNLFLLRKVKHIISMNNEINEMYSNCIEIENKSRTILFENENIKRNEKKEKLLNSIIKECSQASENLLYKDKLDTLSRENVNKCYSLFTKYNLYHNEYFNNLEYTYDDTYDDAFM